VARIARSGVAPLSTAAGLALLDAALADGRALLAPVRLELSALSARAEAEGVAPVWRGLVRPAVRRAASGAAPEGPEALAERLAGLAGPERRALLLELARAEAAAVLGHAGPEAVDPRRGLLDLGFDSLTSVEFRNRLNAVTGLRLPTTLVFDHPTAEAVAGRLAELIAPAAPSVPALAEIDRLEAVLSALSSDEEDAGKITDRLQALLWKWTEAQGDADHHAGEDDLASATDEEMFDALDKELGLS
jgi:hypothetical protein